MTTPPPPSSSSSFDTGQPGEAWLLPAVAPDGPPPELEPGDSPEHPLAPWFALTRGRRRERQAAAQAAQAPGRLGRRGRPRQRSRAVVTIVHNEPAMLAIWLRYYSRFYAPEDIYVLDNESTDEVIARGGFQRIPVAHGSVDHTWMVETVQDLQNDLIDRYDSVLVTDVDEIVAPNPAHGTLADYLQRLDEPWVNCLGYELLHMKDSEPPLDSERPILNQRGWWFFNSAYDKAALATVAMDWRPGFHGRSDFRYNLDPDLRLIHLHRMDYDICLARHRTRARKPWAERDAQDRWAIHNRIVEEAEFERWFYDDSGFPNHEIKPERIPAEWREAF